MRKKDREAKFEQILKEILLELEDKGRKITWKDEQRKAVKQVYGKKDLVAVLPTGFGKSLIFQLLVLMKSTQVVYVLVMVPLRYYCCRSKLLRNGISIYEL